MANHTYQMSINYNAGGQFASNILHFSFDDAGFASTAQAAQGLCAGFDAACRTALRNLLSSHVTILTYKARAINISGGFEGGLTLTSANTGNRTGNLMAAGIGPVTIVYPTGNGTQRGRIFWPGVSDTDCVDGILSAAYKTVLLTSMGTLITPFAVVGGGTPNASMVIWSRRLLQAFNVAATQTSIALGQVRRRQLPA
jgi:hypothetical protein